jgi:23S rRNA (cytosine1962-C5)-methyltransferase
MKTNYGLLDSGNGLKLESIDNHYIIRPSSRSIWNKHLPTSIWENDNAFVYDHKLGWNKKGVLPNLELTLNKQNIELRTRLLDNGQISYFPEHFNYFPEIIEKTSTNSRSLNLFGYTGALTNVLAKNSIHVTHVDLAKNTINWCEENLILNKIPKNYYRLINDEALAFTARELRRGVKYNLIVADPPGFSRISKQNTWQIIDILPKLLQNCFKLLEPENGMLVLTSHQPEITNVTLSNLFYDITKFEDCEINELNLYLSEKESNRKLECGSGITIVSIQQAANLCEQI